MTTQLLPASGMALQTTALMWCMLQSFPCWLGPAPPCLLAAKRAGLPEHERLPPAEQGFVHRHGEM